MQYGIALAALAAAIAPVGVTSPAAVTPPPRPSYNYAGLEVAGPSNQSVSGSWREPTTSCGGPAQLGVWVGLGGIEQEALVQAGTVTSCSLNVSVHRAFYEYIDATGDHHVDLGSVAPNDNISVQIQHVRDRRLGWIYRISIKKNGRPLRAPLPVVRIQGDRGRATTSKEWIVERPQLNVPGTCYGALANFSPVSIHRGALGTGTLKAWKIVGLPTEPDPSARNAVLAEPTSFANRTVTVRHVRSGSVLACLE